MPIKAVMEDKKARLNQQLGRLSDEVVQGKGEIYDLYNYLTTKMKQVRIKLLICSNVNFTLLCLPSPLLR